MPTLFDTFDRSPMRRMPIYILIDITSNESFGIAFSMINTLIQSLRSDPYALESAYISFILHNKCAILFKDYLTPLYDIDINEYRHRADIISKDTYIHCYMPEEENLKTLYGQIIRLEVRKTSVDFKGDWKPINIHISGKKVGIEYGWTNNNLSSSLYGLENNSVDIENNEKLIVGYASYIMDTHNEPISIVEYKKNIFNNNHA